MPARYFLKNCLITLAIVLPALAAAPVIFAGSVTMPVSQDEYGIAIKGYDPVAYFLKGRPVKGDPSYQFVWQDARWHFTNADYRDKFATAPERYAPQYGGFCAIGLSVDVVAGADPQVFKIIDGKLYLGYDRSALKKLEKDPAGSIRKADTNWNRRTDLAAR